MKKDINGLIGNKIRYYRNSRNYTQQRLADKVGVSWEMISRYERGSSSVFNNLDKICDALNVSLSELLIDQNSFNNRIPLFETASFLPQPDQNLSLLTYHCPDWLLMMDKNALALLLSKNVKINIAGIEINNIIYLSKEQKPTDLSLVFFFIDKGYVIDTYSQFKKKSSAQFIGVIVGLEKRFV